MPDAKLTVLYPVPRDKDAFERVYHDEHIPLAAPIFKDAGATRVVMSRFTAPDGGTPAFHRSVAVYFPTRQALDACAASKGGQDALAHAHKISTGGPPTVLVGEEDVVTF